MRGARICLLAALGCLAAAPVQAVTPKIHVDRNAALDCLPLAGGRLLAATRGGLVLLDPGGQVLATWTRLDGLPGTTVHALRRRGEDLWIGTERGLLRARLRGRRLQPVRAWRSRPVRDMAWRGEALYLATWGAGARVLRSATAGLERLAFERTPAGASSAAPRRRLTSVAVQGPRVLFGSAGGGLWRLDPDRPRLLQVSPLPDLPSKVIWSLQPGPDGRLLVGTLGGLVALADERSLLLDSADARALMPLPDGSLLVGTYGQGLRRLRGPPTPPATTSSAGPGAAHVNALRRSHGLTCAATRDGLWVQRGGPGSTYVHFRLPGLPSGDVSALAVDGPRLWVGTFDRGLALVQGGRARALALPGLDRRINALAVERPGVLWVGTSRGACRLQRSSGDIRSIRCFTRQDGLRHDEVHAVLPLRGGGVLLGTGRGAVIVRAGVVQSLGVKQGLPVASVWTAAEDADGSLWLGTTRGLYHWTGERYRRYSVSSGELAEDHVTAVLLHQGSVYAGTYNNGVTRLTREPDGRWTAHHLGGGWINFNGLKLVGQKLYAATMSGLRALPLSGHGTWREHPRAAPGRDVTALVKQGDRLWVASRRGIAAVRATGAAPGAAAAGLR